MAVVNKNLTASITLQVGTEKNRSDLTAIARKSKEIEAKVKNIRG